MERLSYQPTGKDVFISLLIGGANGLGLGTIASNLYGSEVGTIVGIGTVVSTGLLVCGSRLVNKIFELALTRGIEDRWGVFGSSLFYASGGYMLGATIQQLFHGPDASASLGIGMGILIGLGSFLINEHRLALVFRARNRLTESTLPQE